MSHQAVRLGCFEMRRGTMKDKIADLHGLRESLIIVDDLLKASRNARGRNRQGEGGERWISTHRDHGKL